MRKMTKQNLENAFAGESMAHMRYLIFAKKAEKDGMPNLARLFRAIAYAEQVHATNHYHELGMLKESTDNLQTCIDGEHYEVEEMYPAYKTVAELQNEQGAVRSTHYALEAEKIHEAMYQEAKQTVAAGNNIEIGPVSICPVCGYTVEGEVPEACPICRAPGKSFRKF